MYTDKQLDKIKECLHQLLKDIEGNSILYPIIGICANLNEYLKDDPCAYDFICANCKDWEDYSGDGSYPIKGSVGKFYLENLWEGEQLQLRISLINHLINKCDTLKELQNEQ